MSNLLQLYVEHSKLEKVRYSFLRIGPEVCNALPSDFLNSSKFTFQMKLKHRLVQLLYLILQVFARFGKISGRVWSSHGLYFGQTLGRAKIPMVRPNKS